MPKLVIHNLEIVAAYFKAMSCFVKSESFDKSLAHSYHGNKYRYRSKLGGVEGVLVDCCMEMDVGSILPCI